MSTEPVVSVLMPAYKASATITAALQSALRQEGPALEVIVIDDASPDDTSDVVNALGDDRVRLLRNAVNSGPSESRNRGLEVSRGEWIAVLDADDTWEPGRLATLIPLAEQNSVTIVSDDINFLNPGDRTPVTTALLKNKAALMNRVVGTAELIDAEVGMYQPIMHRSVFTPDLRWNPRMRYTEDFDLHLRALLAGNRWYQTQAAYYNYVMWPGSAVTRQVDLCTQSIRNLDTFLADPALAEDTRGALEVRRRRFDYHLRYALMWEAVAARRYGSALADVVRHPGFTALAADHVSRTVVRRAAKRLKREST